MTEQPTYNGIPIQWSTLLCDPDPKEIYWPQRIKDDPPPEGTLVHIIKDPSEMTEGQQRLLAHLCPYYEAPSESRDP